MFLPDDISSDDDDTIVDISEYIAVLNGFQSRSTTYIQYAYLFEGIDIDINGIFQWNQFVIQHALQPMVFLQTMSIDLLLQCALGSLVLRIFDNSGWQNIQYMKHMFEYIALRSEKIVVYNLLVGMLDRILLFLHTYKYTTISYWDARTCCRFRSDLTILLTKYIHTRRPSFRRRELFPLMQQMIKLPKNQTA